MGQGLTLYAIRLSFTLFAVGIVLLGVRRKSTWHSMLGRICWTSGLVLFWAHVLGAYHFFHNWSHAEAVENVREQTAALIGWRFGGGIYVNFVFGLVWTLDVVILFVNSHRDWIRRYVAIRIYIFSFMVFMWINGGVIFASGIVRWFSIFVLVCMFIALWLYRPNDRVNAKSLIDSTDQIE